MRECKSWRKEDSKWAGRRGGGMTHTCPRMSLSTPSLHDLCMHWRAATCAVRSATVPLVLNFPLQSLMHNTSSEVITCCGLDHMACGSCCRSAGSCAAMCLAWCYGDTHRQTHIRCASLSSCHVLSGATLIVSLKHKPMHDVHRHLHPLYVWSHAVSLGQTCKVETAARGADINKAISSGTTCCCCR